MYPKRLLKPRIVCLRKLSLTSYVFTLSMQYYGINRYRCRCRWHTQSLLAFYRLLYFIANARSLHLSLKKDVLGRTNRNFNKEEIAKSHSMQMHSSAEK